MATTFLEPGTSATFDFSFIESTSGTVSSATDQTHGQPHSGKLTRDATTALVVLPSGICADSGSRVSFWFRLTALPVSINGTIGNIIKDGAPNGICAIQINPSGNLVVAPTGATAATGSAILAINTWYRFCLSYYITNTTTFQFKGYINNTLEATANAGTLTRTGSTKWQFQVTTGGFPNPTSMWFSDVYVDNGASSSSQPDTGDVRVTAKRPNANGTTNDFVTQIGASGSGYGSGHSPQVNERALSTTNGWSVVGAGSAVTEEYNIEGVSVGDVDLTKAPLIDYTGWVYAKALTSETGQITVNGATSNISLTSTNTMFRKVAGSTVYPAGTGADIGIITDTTVTTVSLYECGVIFAYNLARVSFNTIINQAVNRASTF